MDWKEQLAELEQTKDWKAAIALVGDEINRSGDIEAYVRAIYLLHHILVEEDYDEQQHNTMAALLKKYFDESYKKFGSNAEYLFFIGKILYIAEWYFGLNDDVKPVEQRLAFQMQKQAWDSEPQNILYEWACAFSLSDKSKTLQLAKQIVGDRLYMDWLKTKGLPGKYVWDAVNWSYEQYSIENENVD